MCWVGRKSNQPTVIWHKMYQHLHYSLYVVICEEITDKLKYIESMSNKVWAKFSEASSVFLRVHFSKDISWMNFHVIIWSRYSIYCMFYLSSCGMYCVKLYNGIQWSLMSFFNSKITKCLKSWVQICVHGHFFLTGSSFDYVSWDSWVLILSEASLEVNAGKPWDSPMWSFQNNIECIDFTLKNWPS